MKMEKWENYKLEEICQIIAGQSPSSHTYNHEKKGLPFYQGKADFGLITPIPKVWCSDPLKIAEKGDILLSVRAPVGPTNLASEKCCIGRGLCAIRASKKVDIQFLNYYFKLFERKITDMGTGSIFQAITIKEVKNINIILPPLEEQKRIARIIEEKMKSIEKVKIYIQEQMQAVECLPSSILRQAFNGEL